MDIRFIYFDVDDTLLDHHYAERAAIADVHAAFPEAFGDRSVEALHRTYHAHSAALWKQYSEQTIDKDAVKYGRFERLLEGVNAPLHPETVSDYYLTRYATHWRFTPGAESAFDALADRFPVGVLTNGFAEIQAQKFDRFPALRTRSEAVIVSEETGYMKPHPKVFAHAAAAADTAPEHILYVGDSLRSDVRGGQNAGWHVAWFARHADAPSESNCFTFTRWEALLEQLR